MIAFVRGDRRRRHARLSAVVEVGGVGLELMCTPNTLATLRVGAPATLPTSMVVREDSLTLFGFLDEDEKPVFELRADRLRRRPQAGPGDARGDDPRRPAPRSPTEDVKALTRCPASARRARSGSSSSSRTGIGAPVGTTGPGRAAPSAGRLARPGARRASSGLGWSAKEAEKAVETVAPRPATPARRRALLRAALRALSKAERADGDDGPTPTRPDERADRRRAAIGR